MKQGILLILIALLLPVAGCKSRARTAESADSGSTSTKAAADRGIAATGSGFDFYLLNLSWSPEYCYAHPAANECAAHAAFVLHGLWPENADGSYPENCSNAGRPRRPSRG
jgi:ribonuclease T2